MKIENKVYKETIKSVFEEYARPTRWTPSLNIMVFNSDVYDIRDFGIVYNREGILYYGYDISQAYWTGRPKDSKLLSISYIREFENNDSIIFFDEEGKNLNNGLVFNRVDNEGGEIIAISNGKWYTITLDGLKTTV